LTSGAPPGYKVDVIKVDSMTSLPQQRAAVNFRTAIARMLGKAVQIRHCPATVSAPALVLVVSTMYESAGSEPGPFHQE
jgi:hypothetical protein